MEEMYVCPYCSCKKPLLDSAWDDARDFKDGFELYRIPETGDWQLEWWQDSMRDALLVVRWDYCPKCGKKLS